MANTDNPNGFSLAKNATGQPVIQSFAIAASQTITKGDAVILASGLVQIAVATSGALLGVAQETITSGASVTRADDRILVAVGTPANIFEGQCSGDSAATSVGAECDIEGATGVMQVNENASVEDVLQIIGLKSDVDADFTIGTNDRVFFTITRSQYDGRVAER